MARPAPLSTTTRVTRLPETRLLSSSTSAPILSIRWTLTQTPTPPRVNSLVGLVAANGVLKSIDGLPLIPDLLELVGIGFSGFYIYQNLLFKPDRAALKESISKSIDKIL